MPPEGRIPKISIALQKAPKELASRFFQLASGHAMIAPFLKEKFGWIESDSCWWCSSGRQTREHLFKECRAWKEEIKELWREVGRISKTDERAGNMYKGRKGFFLGWQERQHRAVRRPGNASVKGLLGEERFIPVVLNFLRRTDVGKLKEGVVIRQRAP